MLHFLFHFDIQAVLMRYGRLSGSSGVGEAFRFFFAPAVGSAASRTGFPVPHGVLNGVLCREVLNGGSEASDGHLGTAANSTEQAPFHSSSEAKPVAGIALRRSIQRPAPASRPSCSQITVGGGGRSPLGEVFRPCA